MDPDYYELERELVALSRSAGPLRAAQAEIAVWLVHREVWERMGYARLSDYADENLGLSARSVRDFARVGRALHGLPKLRDALIEGRLGWTKTRLVARVASAEDEKRWIRYAQGVTAQVLSREVRQVDEGSLERSGLEEELGRNHGFEVPCTRQVMEKWTDGLFWARRVHGGRLRHSEYAEMVLAEVTSVLPIDPDVLDPVDAEAECEQSATRPGAPSNLERVVGPDGDAGFGPGAMPAALAELLVGLEAADPVELERRFRAVLSLDQRLSARMGPLLERVVRRRIYRLLGYPSQDAYMRERLGLDPSWGRKLVRIERACGRSRTFESHYRAGELTPLQALTLVPLVMAEMNEDFVAAWAARAREFALARLRDDVERALLVCETDYSRWLASGGLPDALEARPETGEIGAPHSAANETCRVFCSLDLEVLRLMRAVICTVRRRHERLTGRIPTRGEAIGMMLDHALAAWGRARSPKAHAIFERDGWRCAVPGCTSQSNLHRHHIELRSAGGSDDDANLITLCAFHHLRGVHGGLLRITGKAPDELRFELPHAVYASGDRRISAG